MLLCTVHMKGELVKIGLLSADTAWTWQKTVATTHPAPLHASQRQCSVSEDHRCHYDVTHMVQPFMRGEQQRCCAADPES